jgi:hypothetical protein
VRDAWDHPDPQVLKVTDVSDSPTTDGGYPRRVDALEINEADDGLVVYDSAHDMVHHLNPTASMIFDLCDGTRDVEAIALILEEAYELNSPPADQARAGLDELADRNLIRWDAHDNASD